MSMKIYPDFLPSKYRAAFDYRSMQIENFVKNRWPLLLTLFVAGWLMLNRDISIDFSMAKGQQLFSVFQTKKTSSSLFYDPFEEDGGTVQNVSQLTKDSQTRPEDSEKVRRQKAYVRQYAALAIEEMSTHKIPASITLAQGLLESNIGESRLATQNNNHFGIKCFSKSCTKGHCSNFEDDHHKDFFRKFDSVNESYAAHSKVLQKDRYKGLFDLRITDYKGWSHGLKKAGYATDPRYGDKLIRIIENLDLYQYDY